jgi:putative ATPase
MLTMAAQQAFHFIGPPEGELAIAQAAVYLATAPKSNSLYVGYGRTRELINKTGYLPVPLHIRNAPTKLMKELDYGKDYKYAATTIPTLLSPRNTCPKNYRGRCCTTRRTRATKSHQGRVNLWRKLKKGTGEKKG